MLFLRRWYSSCWECEYFVNKNAQNAFFFWIYQFKIVPLHHRRHNPSSKGETMSEMVVGLPAEGAWETTNQIVFRIGNRVRNAIPVEEPDEIPQTQI